MTIVANVKLSSSGLDLSGSMAAHTRKRIPAHDTETTRIQARAVKRIIDRKSGEVVGWLYEWNTGSLVPRWKSEVHDDVVYE